MLINSYFSENKEIFINFIKLNYLSKPKYHLLSVNSKPLEIVNLWVPLDNHMFTCALGCLEHGQRGDEQ